MNESGESTAVLKPFKHPKLWVSLWVLAIVVLVMLCLMPAQDIPDVANDKIEHAFAYVCLAFGAVQLFATRRALWCAAFGLALLGGAIEIAQGTPLIGRDCDVFDELADCVGIAIGLATVLTPWRDLLLKIERRMF